MSFQRHDLLSSLDAVLAAWRPGEEGGNAIWSLLLGKNSPSGRLSQAWPISAGYVHSQASPWFHKRQGDFDEEAYRGGPSQQTGGKHQSYPWGPLFPFQYGLSYTSFNTTVTKFSGSQVDSKNGQISITIKVRNIGAVASKTVVAVYHSKPITSFVRFHRMLTAFHKTELIAAGSLTEFTLHIPVSKLSSYDLESKAQLVEEGDYYLQIVEDASASKYGQQQRQMAQKVTVTSGQPSGRGSLKADDVHIMVSAPSALRGGLHDAQVKARAAVNAGSDAIVTLSQGTHYLGGEGTGLRLTPEDSANGQRRVTYRADPSAPLGTVAVSGGQALPARCFEKTSETVGPDKLAVYKCKLPQGFPTFFEQLFVDGKRCPRARFPNYDPLDPTVDGGGYANVKGSFAHEDKRRWPSLGNAGILYDVKTFTNQSWTNPANNATMHIFPWGHSSWGILIYDGIERGPKPNSLTWKRGGWHINTHEFPSGDKPRAGGKFFVEAVREEMDAPLEWFLDAKARTVEMVAPAGLDLSSPALNAVAPVISQPFEHVGASNVVIEGINITHTGAQYMLPYDNPSRGDWTIYRGGAVYFEDAINCSVKRCIFDQVGSNGVMVNERNSNIDISGSRFHASGASDVAFVGNRHKSHGTYAAFPTDCSVKNCFMSETGYYDKQVAGVFISNSQRINASHNTIRNVPRAGILMNDGLVGGHDIAYNSIWNSVRDTSDHGPFNSWGRERYWDLAWSHGPGGNGDLVDQNRWEVFPSIHAAGDVAVDITEPVLLRSNMLSHGPQSSDYACADLDDGSSNIITSQNMMIGCAMKNREGDLRQTWGNLIMGDDMNAAGGDHNLRFELTMMNNSDVWRNNIITDLGGAPHVTGVSPANIKYVNEQDGTLILPSTNDFNCIETDHFTNPVLTAHGYGNEPGPGAVFNLSHQEWVSRFKMDAHSVFAADIKLDRQTFQLGADSPCLKLPQMQQLDVRFGLELQPWTADAAVFNVRTSRCSLTNTGQRFSYDAASGYITLPALGSSTPGCFSRRR